MDNFFLETERLTIKPCTPEDFDDLYAIQSDPDIMQYIGHGVRSREEVKESSKNIIAHYQKHGFSFGSVFEKASGLLIGQAGLCYLGNDDSQPEIEVGYRLKKQSWGKGYATELTKALIIWGFNNLAVDKLVAVINPENQGSRHVLEKSGLGYVGKTKYHNSEVLKFEIYKTDAVKLVPYDSNWPEMAKNEIKKLYEILPNKLILDIQHVGSTAIPGILSKPIIDIQIAVDHLSEIKQIAIDNLKSLDYVYWEDNPDLERMFFVKGMPPYGHIRTHHVHIVESSSKHWVGKILFRDYLLAHALDAHEYEKLKIKLAERYLYDREKYTEEKTEFVNRILKKAQEEMLSIKSNNIVSIKNSEHFIWGDNCDGWWLKKEGLFNVVSETMPPGTSEVKHYHENKEQFFYCLDGLLTIELDTKEYKLAKKEGLVMPAGTEHRVFNSTDKNVSFLVISCPNLPEDRINLE